MREFPGYSFTDLPAVTKVPDTTPTVVRNLETCFSALHSTGDFLAAHVNHSIRPDRYTHKNYGSGRAKIHFQGLQRARDGVHAFVTGGDSREPASHLFVLRMSSRVPHSGWCSNLLYGGRPPADDGVIRVIALSREHWHGGGMGLLGDLLVIPLEANAGPSRTVFLDVSDPAVPMHLPALDISGESRSAGAAAIMRLPNGFFVCAIHRDESSPAHIDFYLSSSTDLAEGWRRQPLTWSYADAVNGRRARPKYQNITLLLDAEHPDDPQARLYLIGTENSAAGAPVQEGIDIVDLFRIDFGSAMTAANPMLADVAITQLTSKTLQCRFGWGNLAAVGGVYVDSCGRLNLYAGAHWRPDDLIRFTEFRCAFPDDAARVDDPERGWIELYEHRNFKGRRLTILGSQNADIVNYRAIAVQGGGLDNEISSIRFQLPAGSTYRLYDRPNFDAAGATADLTGTGMVITMSDLRVQLPRLADRVSSSRFV